MTDHRICGVLNGRNHRFPWGIVTPIKVNADNFARAETDRMFADLQRKAGGINRFAHNREPASADNQAVIRLNRDTPYSYGVVDITRGATVTVPEHGERYVSG
jgi:hypothetical protein